MQNQHSRCGKAIRFALLAIAVLGFATAAWSQGPLPVLSTDQIVARLVEKNKERACGLQHYTAVRNYRLEYRGFPHAAVATMVVNVTFDAPGAKRFTVVSSTGPKMLETRIFERLLESEQQAGCNASPEQ